MKSGTSEDNVTVAVAPFSDSPASWNATDRDYPTAICSHDLFQQQVERTPEPRVRITASYDRDSLIKAQASYERFDAPRHPSVYNSVIKN